ncbi:MAG: ROK family protein [Proteobacteria bacterium]|jgi:glucokinase|nr:ROK family protein [Pseudomonadota bacterium]
MKEFAIGIDLGGTNTRIALINRKGEILSFEEFPTHPDQQGESVLREVSLQINAILKKLKCPKENVGGIGLGCAGILSPQKGILYFSPNLPALSNLPIGKLLVKEAGLKTLLENDANAAALGEHWLGAGKGINNIILVTLGTGIGSGIILNGQIWHGANGFAGEFGHTTLFPDGIPCKCGKKGCVEVYCSAPAIVRFARKKLEEGNNSSLRDEGRPLTSRIIFEHAANGDKLSLDVFRQAGTYLGIALSNVFNLLDLEIAILGGKVSEAGDFILKPVREKVKRMAISSPYYHPQVLKAKLGDNAGVLGAARLVFKNAEC